MYLGHRGFWLGHTKKTGEVYKRCKSLQPFKSNWKRCPWSRLSSNLLESCVPRNAWAPEILENGAPAQKRLEMVVPGPPQLKIIWKQCSWSRPNSKSFERLKSMGKHSPTNQGGGDSFPNALTHLADQIHAAQLPLWKHTAGYRTPFQLAKPVQTSNKTMKYVFVFRKLQKCFWKPMCLAYGRCHFDRTLQSTYRNTALMQEMKWTEKRNIEEKPWATICCCCRNSA